MNKRVYPLIAAVSLIASFYAACSESDKQNVAGGISEETNTVAGVLTDLNGNPVQGVPVLARHVSIDSIQFSDTTSAEGEFAFPIVRQGGYGVSAVHDSLAYYETFKYEGKGLNLEGGLRHVASVSGKIALDDGYNLDGIDVSVPGSKWHAEADSLGRFTLSGIPEGRYALLVTSPDPSRYLSAQFAMTLENSGYRLKGPLPAEMPIVEEIYGSHKDSVVCLPASNEYGLLAWWPMDYAPVLGGDSVTTDVRGFSGTAKLYGGVEQGTGIVGNSLRFRSAERFGVIEDDRGILDSLDELTLEAFVKLNDFADDGVYQKNIMGKLGFGAEDDKNVFSLALIRGVCGTEKPSLAFFLADGSGDDSFDSDGACESAVVSNADLVMDSWIYVVVTWKDGSLKIYQNSELVGVRNIGVNLLLPSGEPIFFGKEDLDFELDDVRLGAKAITSADVLYRYYQKTGGKI